MEKLEVIGPWSGTEGGSMDSKGRDGPQVRSDKGCKKGKLHAERS